MNEVLGSASNGDKGNQGHGEKRAACLEDGAMGPRVRLQRAWAWSITCLALAPRL